MHNRIDTDEPASLVLIKLEFGSVDWFLWREGNQRTLRNTLGVGREPTIYSTHRRQHVCELNLGHRGGR